MMRNWYWFLGFLLFLSTVLVFYFYYGRIFIPYLYEGKIEIVPNWFSNVVSFLYPRFEVERNRHDLLFFLQKADQLILRFSLVSIFSILFIFLLRQGSALANQWNDFFSTKIDIRITHAFRVVFFAAMLSFTKDWFTYLNEYANIVTFYRPILLFKLFHLPFPNPTIIMVIFGFYWILGVLTILNIRPIFCSVCVLALFFLIQGYLYSFEKVSHAYATFGYGSMLILFLIYEQQKSIRKGSKLQDAWALQLIKVVIVLVYLMSGLEKLLISQGTWLYADTFEGYIYAYQTPIGMWVVEQDWLVFLLPKLAILFQLGFISVLFYPRLAGLFILAGISFHSGTVLLLGVGAFVNPWVFMYLFLIDWQKIFAPIFEQKN